VPNGVTWSCARADHPRADVGQAVGGRVHRHGFAEGGEVILNELGKHKGNGSFFLTVIS